jgi:hypothetical protein
VTLTDSNRYTEAGTREDELMFSASRRTALSHVRSITANAFDDPAFYGVATVLNTVGTLLRFEPTVALAVGAAALLCVITIQMRRSRRHSAPNRSTARGERAGQPDASQPAEIVQ